ncbi:serine hydrolase domain-containing protein [Microcoleus sp. A006_D1]|uniref:serine hydrolase domain-containing protein n=1 Tax=Microcoleus sp. A006_D1 TaxID=3055267 RepID=UPI002FD1EFE3
MPINFSRMNRFVALVVLCLLFIQLASAQILAAPQLKQQIVVKAEEYMNAAVKVNRFSGSILVARDGKPLISKGYGMANLELDVPNKPQTVFRLGSLTKQFTAMAIMILQERGKLHTNDLICNYLSDCPAAWQSITIRSLLTHTSGIPNYTSLPNFLQTMQLPSTHANLVERFKNMPLEFTPGEKFKYTNSGYYLLGMIIEQVSGKSYPDFLQENIFAPLGMTHTGYDSHNRLIKNRAGGYELQDNSIINASYIDMSIPFAAGALYSTTEDLLLWDQALYTEKLVSRQILAEIFTPFKDGYGYGWGITKRFDRQMIGHDGSINGFFNSIIRFPSDHVTAIVLSNNQNAPSGEIASSLAAIVFGAPYKMPQERKSEPLPN